MGTGYASSAPLAVTSMHASCFPSYFLDTAYAVLGFGAAGAAAAKAAAAACRDIRNYEDLGCLAALGGMQSGPDAVDAALASEWSFSVLCSDAADQNAMFDAEAVARELARRGHMAVLLGTGWPAAPLAISMAAPDGQNQPARLFLPIPNRQDGLNSDLAASAAMLLSSVACRGIVGVDASDIWSVIGGPSPGIAVRAVAKRGQDTATLVRSAVSAAYEMGIHPRLLRRGLISVVLPREWNLRELDEVVTNIADALEDTGTTVMSAVYDSTADTKSVLLVRS